MIFALCRRLVPVVTALLIGQAGAATFTVTSTGDQSDAGDGAVTLQEAVSSANQDSDGESTIVFDLGPDAARIELTATLILDQPTIINGAGSVTLAVAEPAAETAASMGTLLSLTANAGGTVLRGLRFEGHEELDLLDTAANVSVESSSIHGFRQVILLSGSALAVSLRDCILSDNRKLLSAGAQAWGSTRLTEGSLTLDRCLLVNNDSIAKLRNHTYAPTPFVVSLSRSRITGQNGFTTFELSGSIALELNSSTIDANNVDTLVLTEPNLFTNQLPEVTISNTTVSGNQWNGSGSLIITPGYGPGVFIEHSTLTNNSTDNGSALISSYHAFVSHSVIGENPGVAMNLAGSGELLYSLVENYGEHFTSLFEITGDPLLGPLTFDDLLTGRHLPDIQSPLIGAGNPSLIAGDGDTPAEDQRGSERVINGVIDIGAVEFNRAPTLDISALVEGFNQAQPVDQPELSIDPDSILVNTGGIVINGTMTTFGFGATNLSVNGDSIGDIDITGIDLTGDIVVSGKLTRKPTISAATTANVWLDMDAYVSDPDGDQVTEIIRVSSPVGIWFDKSTHVLSGNRDRFLEGPIVMALTDEHGLTALSTVQLAENNSDSGPEGNSSGGGAGLWLVAVLMLLRRRHP